MAAEGEAGTTHGPGAPLDLRVGVPDDRLASRDLLVLGGVEVARTRYLPSEMEVPPLRGHTVNLRLGGRGRVVTRFGGRTHERALVAGLVEVFTGYEPLEWALEGSVSDNVNVLLGRDFVRRVAAGANIDTDRVEVVDVLNAHDPNAERILTLFLEEVRSGGLGENCTRNLSRPPSPCTCCASILRSATVVERSLRARAAAYLRVP
jgi:hypothetical protein